MDFVCFWLLPSLSSVVGWLLVLVRALGSVTLRGGVLCCFPSLVTFLHLASLWPLFRSRLVCSGPHAGPNRWLGLLLFGLSWRVGEALVPGPTGHQAGGEEASFTIGVCNPNGLVDKAMFFSDFTEDIWCVSETHLSQAGRRTFSQMLARHAKQYTSLSFGHDGLPRSEVSEVGRWTGVGIVSQWPTRRLEHDWSSEVHVTGRICVNTSFVHGHWISGCVVYGPPTGPTHGSARHTADALLNVALSRVLQLSGPRYISGDWNHDHDRLESVHLMRQLGFVDIQDLNLACHGIPPVATCRGKTRWDFLFVSPELVCMFRKCEVRSLEWTDHSALIGTFTCTAMDFARFPWPRPDAIDWARFRTRPLSDPHSFVDADDVSLCYADMWQQVEHSVQSMAQQEGKPLPDRCFGRGQRSKPCHTRFEVTPVGAGRSGDVRPSFLGFSHIHRLWFRQLRRLQSFCRLVRYGIHTWDSLEHRAFLWTSILNANGFRPGFATWWTLQG